MATSNSKYFFAASNYQQNSCITLLVANNIKPIQFS